MPTVRQTLFALVIVLAAVAAIMLWQGDSPGTSARASADMAWLGPVAERADVQDGLGLHGARHPSMEPRIDRTKDVSLAIQDAILGEPAAFRRALTSLDSCAVFDRGRAVAGAAANVYKPPSGDPALMHVWREAMDDWESECAVWNAVQVNPLTYRMELMKAAGDAAVRRGEPRWAVDFDSPMPGLHEAIRALKDIKDPAVMAMAVERIVASDEGVEFLESNGFRHAPMVGVPELAVCRRFGQCSPTRIQLILNCLHLYACNPGQRFDQLHASGLASRHEEQLARQITDFLLDFSDRPGAGVDP